MANCFQDPYTSKLRVTESQDGIQKTIYALIRALIQ